MESQPGRSNANGEVTTAGLRAALYLRVSTGRQAEHDLSIPDQRSQTAMWAAARGLQVVAEYIEPGASATDDRRPEFQRMVERACDGECAFDIVVVHSFSRFFRDAFGLWMAGLASLEREAETAEEKLKRLYKLIEDGVAEVDDLLKDRIAILKAGRDRAKEALNRARCGVRAKGDVSQEAVEKFGALMRGRLLEGETPARKAWIGAIIDGIEADQGTIRIMGRKDVLEQAVANGGQITPSVRTCVPKWRTGEDSNS